MTDYVRGPGGRKYHRIDEDHVLGKFYQTWCGWFVPKNDADLADDPRGQLCGHCANLITLIEKVNAEIREALTEQADLPNMEEECSRLFSELRGWLSTSG